MIRTRDTICILDLFKVILRQAGSAACYILMDNPVMVRGTNIDFATCHGQWEKESKEQVENREKGFFQEGKFFPRNKGSFEKKILSGNKDFLKKRRFF